MATAMSDSKRKSAKVKFPKRKVFGRVAIAAYLVYQAYIVIKYGSGQNVLDGEFSSALGPLLSEFKGEPTTNGPHRSVGSVGNTFTSLEIGKQRDAKEASTTKDYNNPLERDFLRIPGYLQGSNDPSLFGYVMRDLANRFFKKSSAQQQRRQLVERQFSPSNILVVSPNAPELLEKIKKKKPATIASKKELIKSFGYKIGGSFLVESVFHGHNAIAIDSNTGFPRDDWSKATDITLAILDPAQGQEDSVVARQLEEYIRAGTIEFATFRVSSSILGANHVNLETKMQGIETSKKFLQAGYKLQVLSSSYAPTDGLNPYGPNTLLKNFENVQGFLRFGAGLAQSAQDIRHSKHASGNLTLPSKMKETPATFQSILFATRGLDLAIPSRKAFLNLTAHGSDFVLDVEKDGVPYAECPKSFMTATESEDDKFDISCFGVNLTMQESERRRIDYGNKTVVVELWHSHNDLSLSEAVCLKCTRSTMDATKPSDSDSVCINRIRSTTMNSSNLSAGKSRGPNLLAIELKGVNQVMLNSSLGHLRNISDNIGLDYFPNFASSATISNPNDDHKWWTLWDNGVMEDGGYQTYRGSNQCDPSSQSRSDDPALFHGSQMGRMFCFNYDRPNCIGGLHAATHLLSHVKKFISQNQEAKERWASYVTLIDGVEETETLAGGLDLPLSDFLSEIKAEMTSEEWSNTVIAIFSNDVQKPVLFLKTKNGTTGLLKKQKALFTSDLHLIVRSILSDKDIQNAMPTGIIPDHANVPTRPVEPEGRDEHNLSEGELESPPSVLSFYADIPKEHKFQLIQSYPGQPPKRAKPFRGCNCTTDTFPWIPCDYHPWDGGGQDKKETYILFACPGQPLHLEINVIPNERTLKRSFNKRVESSSDHLSNTNIIFLELDSVSQEYADRHFPKTRELLEKYRIKRNGENKFECTDGFCSAEFPYTALVGANSVPNQVAALSGCITATTQEFCGLNTTTAQPGDICNDPNVMHYGFRLDRLRRSVDTAYWCPKRDQEVTKTPWIFGVSHSKGYINFFGEEFCYDHSPYVTQGNVFPVFYFDIQSHKVFCSLVERKVATEKKLAKSHRKNWWGVDLRDPCLGGYVCHPNSEKSSISLQFIEQVWNAYDSQPKLAFLNAMAAHDYSADWEMMIPRAEVYDEHVHKFLESMLSRTDSQHTVIILRSDHGLQKGPMSMDYSLQVEHRHPWTEILVPENLIVSKEALFNNQGRMLTGYDFYKTMRLLMSDRSNPRNVGEGIPDWSFDVLAEEISPQRKCEEAKIDPSLCPHVKQTRQYGVCNRLDPNQARFCEMER